MAGASSQRLRLCCALGSSEQPELVDGSGCAMAALLTLAAAAVDGLLVVPAFAIAVDAARPPVVARAAPLPLTPAAERVLLAAEPALACAPLAAAAEPAVADAPLAVAAEPAVAGVPLAGAVAAEPELADAALADPPLPAAALTPAVPLSVPELPPPPAADVPALPCVLLGITHGCCARQASNCLRSCGNGLSGPVSATLKRRYGSLWPGRST